MPVRALAMLAVASILLIPSLDAKGGVYRVNSPAGVYYGNPEDFACPAVLEAARVFDHIPEYQEIKRRNLQPTDPEYGILLEKANKRFFKVVCRVARRDAYDLMAELGAVTRSDGKPIKDVTDDLIKVLEEDR